VTCRTLREIRNEYKILKRKRKPEDKRPLERVNRKWGDNIKIDFKETESERGYWIQLAQDTTVDVCENDDEQSGSIKGGNILTV